MRFAIKIGSFTAAALDMGFAYLVIDVIMKQSLTWPVLLLGLWVTDTVMTPIVKEALLKDRLTHRR